MKRKNIRLVALALLGGVLGVPALFGTGETVSVKAEEVETKIVNATSSKITSAIKNSYSNYTFTIDGVSFGSKNLCYQGSSGSEYFQVKGNTENGLWTTSTFEDFYISNISMTVASNAGKIGLGETSTISVLSNLPIGNFSKDYSESDNFSYLKIMSAGSTLQIKNLKIVYTAKSGEEIPPVEGDYALVKDASILKSGDQIILGVSSKNVAAGSFSSKSLVGVPAKFVNETLTSEDSNVLTLSKTENGFKLYSSQGFVGTTVAKELSVDTETEWTISIDSDSYKATIEAGELGHMMYNCNNASLFRNYLSSESASMILPEIYINTKAVASTFSITYDGNGATGTTVDENTYALADQATVLANNFDVVTGQVFKEWNTKADGSGKSYNPGDKLTMTADVTLFAIFEEEYVPVGDTFTKVTSVSALNDGDKFLFVYNSGSTVKVNGSLEGSDHFAAYDANIVNDELSYNNEKVTPLTLVKEGSDFYIQLDSSYLTVTGSSSNKLAWKAKDKASKWSISFDGGNVKVSTTYQGTSHSIFYNASGTGRFANYISNSMSPVELWTKSGHAKEVHLSIDTIDINVGGGCVIAVSECVGFEPTSYVWEVTKGQEIVSIINGQGTSEIFVRASAEGEAEVYVTVNGVKAKAEITVHDYKYNILSKDAYYITADGAMMCGDLSYNTNVDFTESNMWEFEKVYQGDNSYYLRSDGKYLTFSEDYYADGKNISEIELTDVPYNVWTVTYTEGKGYMVSTQTNNYGVRSLATHEEKWYAFNDNHYVKLLEAGSYDHYEVKALPTVKQYFVGEELKPLNSHIYAVYSNGFETEITSNIVWDTLVEGTKATGKVTIGGEERTIEMEGIQVYKGDASSFVIEGLRDNYALGEKINKDFLSVKVTYKLSGYENITKTLGKDDYVITPERIEEGTTSVRIALAKDPTVYYEKTIEIKDSPYVAANYVGVGDVVTIATLGYNRYEITGGVELTYENSKFGYSNFGYLPRGEMSFEVGKSGSYYTLKDTETGYYLKGDNSTPGFNMPDFKSIYAEGDGHYEFNMPVTIGGNSYIVTMKTENNPDFSYTNVFSSFDYLPGSFSDYIVGTSDLENKRFVFDTYIGGIYSKAAAEVSITDWSFINGVFSYALEIPSELPEECLFTLSYDDEFEEWAVSSKPHQDKQLYFNKDGKFGFYAKGSSYTPVMLFRDNDKELQSTVTSLSVSFREGMDEVSVGEAFPWTSALIVKANYSGGASKIIPVGGYSIIEIPDTSKVGKAIGKVAYGQNGHQIEKEFTITVKGETQAFDVVCKDPILVGETYQAHLADHYAPPVDEPITWSVSDPTLASIDQDGNVTGLAPGYVDVIATSYDGTYSDFEHIRIYQQVESVTLSEHSFEINAGETHTLSATVLPTNASNLNVTYESSDPSIAFVDSKTGVVTGVAPGKATITCRAQNQPEKNFDTCEVIVKEAPIVHVTGISLDCTSKELQVNDTFKLNATITPSNATVKNVRWSSSNEAVATVDQNGNVKAKSTGKATIMATTADGEYEATCQIVVKTSAEVIHVTSVSLNKSSLSLDKNETYTLVATVNPGNANNKAVLWSSSNENVATVTNGVVVAVGEGSCTITVTTVDGAHTATCAITVRGENVNPTPEPEPEEKQEEKKSGIAGFFQRIFDAIKNFFRKLFNK